MGNKSTTLKFAIPDVAPYYTGPTGFIRQQPMTASIRREIIVRFEKEQLNYESIRSFSEVESRRLERLGITYTPNAISALVCRRRGKLVRVFIWEKLLLMFKSKNARTGDYWYDFGDIQKYTGILTSDLISKNLTDFKKRHGCNVKRRRASFAEYADRGWSHLYRLWASV